MTNLNFIPSRIVFVIQKLILGIISAKLLISNPLCFTIIGPTIIIANEGGYLKEKGYYVKGHFSRACLRGFYLGSTTVNIIKRNKIDFNVVLLTTNNNVLKIYKQALDLKVKNVIINNK